MMKIGELAAATGVSVETLRFYEARGLISSDRTPNGYRQFPEAAIEVVRYIRVARDFGFSLAELTPLRHLTGERRGAAERAMLVEKAAALETRIAELTELRTRLQESLAGSCRLAGPSPLETGSLLAALG